MMITPSDSSRFCLLPIGKIDDKINTLFVEVLHMETCYKAFRADLLKTIPLRSNRFGIEPEITSKLARRKAIIYEVPISYHGRAYEEGKKIGWKDGVSAIWTILKYACVEDSDNRKFELPVEHQTPIPENITKPLEIQNFSLEKPASME